MPPAPHPSPALCALRGGCCVAAQDQSCARARSCEEEEEGGGMRGGGGYEAEENLKKGVSEVKPSSFWR